MLDQRLVQLMQRLLEEAAPSTPLRAVSRRLKDDFNIGRVKGQTLHLGERDRELIRELLVAGGHAVTRVDLKSLSRSDRLAAGTPYEKAGGGTLKNGRVSIKALAGKMLDVAGTSLSLPDRSHVDIEWRRIVEESGHNAIMLVENVSVSPPAFFSPPRRCRTMLPFSTTRRNGHGRNSEFRRRAPTAQRGGMAGDF